MSGSADRPTWNGNAEAFEGWNVFWATLREESIYSTLQVADRLGSEPVEVERVFRGRVVSLLQDWLKWHSQEPESRRSASSWRQHHGNRIRVGSVLM